MKRVFVGMTGASGHRYGEALVRALASAGLGVDLCVSGAGLAVLRHELGVEGGDGGEELERALPAWIGAELAARVRVHHRDAIGAPAASGSAGTLAVVIAPCSMGTLARIAAGFSSNLVERAADVALKEGRRLVLVPRETPLSELHLENMLRLARMGAVILPAMPGWYHRPASLDELVDQLVGKLLDRLGVEHAGRRWAGLEPPPGDAGIERPGQGSTA